MGANVARTIDVPLMPAAVATPTTHIDGRGFLNAVLKGCAIEHMGRRMILALAPGPGSSMSLFFRALSFAFNHHHPFALRPEVLGYLINHEIAETVRRHPEHYRHLFTTRPDALDIEIRDDSLAPGRRSTGAERSHTSKASCEHTSRMESWMRWCLGIRPGRQQRGLRR